MSLDRHGRKLLLDYNRRAVIVVKNVLYVFSAVRKD